MLIAARNGFLAGKRLPYDAEVEYLESTGTQWIDTAVPCNTDLLSCSATFMVLSWARYRGIFGAYINEESNAFRILQTDADNNRAWATCGYVASRSVEFNLSHNQWHEVSLYKVSNTVVCDGTVYFGGTGTLGNENARSIHLFRSDTPGSQIGSRQVRIAHVSFASNSVLIRDFLSVRFTNEAGQPEGAMYDRLGTGGMNPDGSARTDGLYRNIGTGAFVIGPDKSVANGGGGISANA